MAGYPRAPTGGVARRRGAAERWSRGAADSVRHVAAGRQPVSKRDADNPLAVGAIAAGIGAAIGFALPETERENELMGQSRDAMVDRAQDLARDAAERVTNAADSVKGAGDQAIDHHAQRLTSVRARLDREPGDDVLALREVKQRQPAWPDAGSVRHGVDGDVGFRALQPPRRMMDVEPPRGSPGRCTRR